MRKEEEKEKNIHTFILLIFTFILNKTTTFKEKEDFMIEFIVMLPSLCGNISEKHEIDEGSLSKEEKPAFIWMFTLPYY